MVITEDCARVAMWKWMRVGRMAELFQPRFVRQLRVTSNCDRRMDSALQRFSPEGIPLRQLKATVFGNSAWSHTGSTPSHSNDAFSALFLKTL
jgi:hypothetical protein